MAHLLVHPSVHLATEKLLRSRARIHLLALEMDLVDLDVDDQDLEVNLLVLEGTTAFFRDKRKGTACRVILHCPLSVLGDLGDR